MRQAHEGGVIARELPACRQRGLEDTRPAVRWIATQWAITPTFCSAATRPGVQGAVLREASCFRVATALAEGLGVPLLAQEPVVCTDQREAERDTASSRPTDFPETDMPL
jgi:hypothetical protein